MSLRFALGLAVLVFLGTLLARLPAGAVAALLPATVVCDQATGTLWHGSCGRVHSGAVTLDDLGWTLHPTDLLRLRLSADVTSADPRATGQAQVQLERGGGVAVHALVAHLPLQGGLSIFPPGIQGTVEIDVATLRLQGGALTELVGTLRALQLRSDNFGEFGSFELLFPASAERALTGQLRDLAGPLSVQGELRLTPQAGYELSGTVLARPSASPNLAQTLQLIGPPDSQGRRSFSVAGTL